MRDEPGVYSLNRVIFATMECAEGSDSVAPGLDPVGLGSMGTFQVNQLTKAPQLYMTFAARDASADA